MFVVFEPDRLHYVVSYVSTTLVPHVFRHQIMSSQLTLSFIVVFVTSYGLDFFLCQLQREIQINSHAYSPLRAAYAASFMNCALVGRLKNPNLGSSSEASSVAVNRTSSPLGLGRELGIEPQTLNPLSS